MEYWFFIATRLNEQGTPGLTRHFQTLSIIDGTVAGNFIDMRQIFTDSGQNRVRSLLGPEYAYCR